MQQTQQVVTRYLFDRIDRTIASKDAMYGGNDAHYFNVGASALKAILDVVSIAQTEPSKILDFGCGAGRVTRWLSSCYPKASIEACDVDADLQFVADRFGAKVWKSAKVVEKLSAPSTYDLIWVGSVFTHLPAHDSTRMFDKLLSWLNPSGILVFTSHGRKPALIGPESGFYGIPDQWEKVVSDFTEREYGYADYQGTPGYGISLIQLRWWASLVSSRPNVRLISMTEEAWDKHQDVICVQARGG